MDLPAYFLPKDPPNGHPLWCDKFDHVKHSHPVFDFDENSGIDLHPLPLNTTRPTFYITDSTEEHFTFGSLEEPFIVMCMLFDRNIVTSEDWQKYPTNTLTLAIRKQLDEEYMRWRGDRHGKTYNPQAIDYPPGIPQNFFTRIDHPSQWNCQELGPSEIGSWYDSHYSHPFENDNDRIAYNPWNPKILVLRKARIYAEEGMRRLAQFMVLPQIREFVDNFPKGNPTTHYFYHHCHIFRYIEALNPHLIQTLGFNAECHHYDPVGPEGHRNNRRIRKPNRPVNPLLTVEEDEFLYHCAIVFEVLRLVDIAGELIGVRQAVPYLPDHAWILFDSDYLTPCQSFDDFGNKFPLLWEPPIYPL